MKTAFLFALLLLAGCTSVAKSPDAPAHGAHVWLAFDRDRVLASAAEGQADRAAARAVTVEDPVRVASISKLVVALGVMRMVEAGTLDLDRDVSHWLGWTLRNPAFPDKAITLRSLLSHRSSLRDDVDYVIPLDRTLQETLAAPLAFDPAHGPGSFFRYSNLNFPVVATVMEKTSGERFDRLMQRLVLAPLELDACFNWTTCSDAAAARAVVLYTPAGEAVRDDLKGTRPLCPVSTGPGGACQWQAYRVGTNGALFSPQGGLRISAAGLARVGQLLLRDGRLANGSLFLSEASMRELTRDPWRYNGTNGETEKGFYCSYGLAVQILASCIPGDDPFQDGRPRQGHAGEAYGLRSGLWVDRETGKGVVYFATGVAEDAPPGRSAYRAIEEWLAARATRSR